MSMHVEHGMPVVPLPAYVHRMPPAATGPAKAQPPPWPPGMVTELPLPFSAYTLLSAVLPVFLVPTKTTSGVLVIPQTDSDLSFWIHTPGPPCNMLVAANDGLVHCGKPVLVSTAYTNPSWDVT